MTHLFKAVLGIIIMEISKREIVLCLVIAVMFLTILVLSAVVIIQSDPCPSARDRCLSGCGDGFGSGLCKAACTSSYENCEQGVQGNVSG